MKILSAVLSSIWNAVTFMDKEQRALVAHVLTVSQAHPKGFSYNDGLWKSQGLKITFDKSINSIWLSNVKYKLGWRANAILARHFAMLHICLHHEHIGKALSDIDRVENPHAEDEPKKKADTYDNQQTVGDLPTEKVVTANVGSEFNMVTPTDGFATKVVKVAPELIDLSEFVGEEIVATKRDGGLICGEVKTLNNGCYHISDHIYLRRGVVWHGGKPASKRDIVKIELAPQPQPIDLSKYVGKNCYVEMSNGDKGNCYVNYLQTEDAVLLLDSELLFSRYGTHVYGSDLHVTLIQELEGSFRDCIKADDGIEPVDNFDSIDLTKYIGKQIIAARRNGNQTTGVVAKDAEIEVGSREIRFAGLSFDKYGNHRGGGRHCGLDIMSVEEIKQPEWTTDIDLTQWIGKTVDVKLRNGTIFDAVAVSPCAGKILYQVKVEHVSYTRWGKYWQDRLDDRDIAAIKLTN